MSIYKRNKTLKESTVMFQVLPLSGSMVKSALNLYLQSKTCEPAVPSINASAELPCLFHQFSACGFIYFQRPAYRFIKACYSQLLGSGTCLHTSPMEKKTGCVGRKTARILQQVSNLHSQRKISMKYFRMKCNLPHILVCIGESLDLPLHS